MEVITIMKIIILDPGHGGTDPGAVYKEYREKNFTLSIALKVREYIENHFEATIIMTRETDKTVSLDERTDFANQKKADYFCSIHINAGGGAGFESYIYNGTVPEFTKQAQTIIHQQIIEAIEGPFHVKNRGQKRANFHVLRESKMPASLLEILFIDTDQDLKLLLNPSFIQTVSNSIGEGIAKALSLPRKQNSNEPNTIYKVIAGSFKDRDNGEKRVHYLKNQGITSFITSGKVNGELYYRVQAGAFENRKNAEDRITKLDEIGIKDAFVIEEGKNPPFKPIGFSILGASVLTATELDQYVKSINPKAPALGDLYITLGKDYGIRGDVAFAQAIHETNYFRFTGDVRAEQHNYAGLGATGNGERGATFQTPKEGILAHLQHLFAYASTQPLPPQHPKVDPRFSYVERGSAQSWIALNGKWAVPGNNYGQLIIERYKQSIQFVTNQLKNRVNALEKYSSSI
jgi:N-acetylmuramoyl-L-alanine amidase